MRPRTLATAAVLATAALLPMTGTAAAAPDRDCPDFATQAEAQAALDARTGDPERLDRDKDGIACETEFGEPTDTPTKEDDDKDDDESDDSSQIGVVPRGGVETGDGSSTSGSAPAFRVLYTGSAQTIRLSR